MHENRWGLAMMGGQRSEPLSARTVAAAFGALYPAGGTLQTVRHLPGGFSHEVWHVDTTTAHIYYCTSWRLRQQVGKGVARLCGQHRLEASLFMVVAVPRRRLF